MLRAAHSRELDITLEPINHRYIVKGFPENYFVSTTTFIHQFQVDKFDVAKMAPICAAKRGISITEMLSEWDATRDFGTNMHAKIEDYLNFQESQEPTIENEQQKICWEQFKNFWKSDNNIIDYRPEMRIYDQDLKIAGSIDMLAGLKNGAVALYDWKFVLNLNKGNQWSKNMASPFDHLLDTNYYHYTLQLNVYKHILERQYGVKVAKMCLVQMHPKLTNFIVHEMTDLSDLLTEYFANLIDVDSQISSLENLFFEMATREKGEQQQQQQQQQSATATATTAPAPATTATATATATTDEADEADEEAGENIRYEDEIIISTNGASKYSHRLI